MNIRPFYTVGEIARFMSGGKRDTYRNEWVKRATTFLRSKGVRTELAGKNRIVYLSALRETWPELYDGIQLQKLNDQSCADCGADLECPHCDRARSAA